MKFRNEFYGRGDCISEVLGAYLLESKKVFLGQGFIVLAVVKNREYVTWYMAEDKCLAHGHYFLDIGRALKDFEERN